MYKKVIFSTFLWLVFCGYVLGATPPILVLLNENSQLPNYCNFTPEILTTEGFSEYDTTDLTNLTSALLSQYSLVILPETHDANDSNLLNESQIECLSAYVTQQAGNLIAFKPDTRLASLFGLEFASSHVTGDFQVPTTNWLGKGLVSIPLRVHGRYDTYQLEKAGGELGTCVPGDEVIIGYQEYPNHGQALAFGYNLPANIVATRQGNPDKANADWNKDGNMSAQDLFVDNWNNTQYNAFNPGDMQMSLLSHAIEYFLDTIQPLPRAWYFPNRGKSMILFTSDGEDSLYSDQLSQVNDVLAAGGTMTLYIKNVNRLTTADADSIRTNVLANGCEISIHPDDIAYANAITYSSMSNVYQNRLTQLSNILNLTNITTVRNHWLLWCMQGPQKRAVDYLAEVNLEAMFGVKMDCNYYHYDQSTPLGDYLGGPGGFAGSGLIMKFALANGQISSVYQSVTQLPDQEYQINITNHAPEALKLGFQSLLDKSLQQEAYTFINVNFHTDRWVKNGHDLWAKPAGLFLLNYARQLNVPVCSAEAAWAFVDARNRATIALESFAHNQARFTLNPALPCPGYTCMLPLEFAGNTHTLSDIEVNGTNIDFVIDTCKGTQYAFFTVDLETTRVPVVATYRERQQCLLAEAKASLVGNDKHIWELGTRFSSSHPGRIEGIRVFAPAGDEGTHHCELWRNDNAQRLYSTNLVYKGTNGWVTNYLATPIQIDPGVEYTVSVSTAFDGSNIYPYEVNYYGGKTDGCLSWPNYAGVYTPVSGQMPKRQYYYTYFRDVLFTPTVASLCENLFPNATATTSQSSIPLELGYRFIPNISGKLAGVRFFAVNGESGAHTISVWKNDGSTNPIAGPFTVPVTGHNDWFNYALGTPLPLEANTEYTVSISTGDRTNGAYYYASAPLKSAQAGNNGGYLNYPANASVISMVAGQKPVTPAGNVNFCRDILFEPHESIFSTNSATASTDRSLYHLGTVFSSKVPGKIHGVRHLVAKGEVASAHTYRIWRKDTQQIVPGSDATATPKCGSSSWAVYKYETPITIEANVEYIVSVSTSGNSPYAYAPKGCYYPASNGQNLSIPSNAGVFTTDSASMPNSMWNQTCYFRDVIFEADAADPATIKK